jgi:DNA polymerase III delta prime subunit
MKDSVWLKVAVPVALKEDFKIACWLEGSSQTDKMLNLMHREVVANKEQIEEAKKVRKS